jgi:hypothetical protein
VAPLRKQLSIAEGIHQADIKAGYGRVFLPFALSKKYPNADREWAWQYLFPSTTLILFKEIPYVLLGNHIQSNSGLIKETEIGIVQQTRHQLHLHTLTE